MSSSPVNINFLDEWIDANLTWVGRLGQQADEALALRGSTVAGGADFVYRAEFLPTTASLF
jgi:hypothetical protein